MGELLMDPLQSLAEIIRGLLGPFAYRPYAAITVLLFCIFIQVITAIIYRAMTDIDKLNRYQSEIMEWRSKYMKALKSGDKKTLDRLNKRKRRIERLQVEVFKASMRAWVVLFFPLLALWNLFNRVIATSEVAYFPLLGRWLDFNSWYFIAIFAVSFIFRRFLGIKTR